MLSRRVLLVFLLVLCLVNAASGQKPQTKQQPKTFPVEVFQVLGLPLNVHEASLLERDSGYVLRCRLSSESTSAILGMKYSLTAIDPVSGARPIVNRIEGFELGSTGTRTVTFATTIRVKPERGSRLVLMLEQVLSRESIWEVIKAKDALEAYVMGDYSIQPNVLRVANQIDAPPVTRLIYRLF
jgi:hypothetical protein